MRKIQYTTARHSRKKPQVAARLSPTGTSAVPWKLESARLAAVARPAEDPEDAALAPDPAT